MRSCGIGLRSGSGSGSGALRGVLLVVLVVGAVPLTACARPLKDAASPPVVDQLGSMLVDASAVNAIMGSNTFRAYHTYRSMPGWPQGDVYSRPECLAVLANAMEPVYRGSRYGQLRETQLADNGPITESTVDEAVIAFDTAGDAQAFVVATAQTWKHCADSALTITSTDRPARHWSMAKPRVVNGVEVVDADDSDSPSEWRTSHAMRATSNVVIDVRVTGYKITDQAVRVVNAIAGRNPL
jgi:serine/threonine kinase PknH